MRRWFLSGLLLICISLLISSLTGNLEILVYFNEIIGILSLTCSLYLYIGIKWFYRLNELRDNHAYADYQKKNLLKYKFLLFGLPNVIVGEIVNQIYGIWG